VKGVTRVEAILIVIVIILAVIGGYGWSLALQKPKVVTSPTPKPTGVVKKPVNITIVDSAGRYVTVPWPLKRIVALTTDSLEVLIALHAEDLVVGVTAYVKGKPELTAHLGNVTYVGTCFKPNIEAIVSVKPQVVITYVRWPKPEVLDEKLKPFGIKVIRLDFYKISTLFTEVKLLGLLINHTKEADEFVKFWNDILTSIRSKVLKLKPNQMVRVYFEGYHDYVANGPGSGGDDDLKMAGGVNIFGDSPIPYPKVSSEAVIEKNPDVIIKAVSTAKFKPYGAKNASILKEIRDSIMSRPGWSAIKAVKEGRVYIISGALTAGPRAVIAIAYIAKWLYPDLFKDLHPEEILKTYFEKFLRVPCSGIWVYP